MKMETEVHDFLADLYIQGLDIETWKELNGIINRDILVFQNDTTDRILERRMKLPFIWDHYKLSDLDIYYEEGILSFCSMMETFGIRDMIPPVKSTDVGLVVVYRFTMSDIYGGTMDMVTGFHVFIKNKDNNLKDCRIIVYG